MPSIILRFHGKAPLLLVGPLPLKGTVTVELAPPFRPVVVHPDGLIRAVSRVDLSVTAVMVGTVDGPEGILNPEVLKAWAEKKGYEIQPAALDLLVGQWCRAMGVELGTKMKNTD